MLMLCFVTWADDTQIHAKGPLIDRPWASSMITREKGEKERRQEVGNDRRGPHVRERKAKLDGNVSSANHGLRENSCKPQQKSRQIHQKNQTCR